MNSQNLIAELEHEWISTAKLLHLVPADKLNWQPNAKAMPLGTLANHVAAIPARYLTFATNGNTDVVTLTLHAQPKAKDEILNNFNSSLQQSQRNTETLQMQAGKTNHGTLQK